MTPKMWHRVVIAALVLWNWTLIARGAPLAFDETGKIAPEIERGWGEELNAQLPMIADTDSCNKTVITPMSRAAHAIVGETFSLDPTVPGKSAAESEEMYVDMDEARMMAHMSSVAYCRNITNVENWNCSRCSVPGIEGFKTHEAFFIAEWEVAAYIGHFPATNATVIVFRGTNSHSLWNWIEDLSAYRRSYPLNIPGTDGAYVHSGFFSLWNRSGLYDKITNSLAELLGIVGWGNPLYISGHSMGGALATLCSMYMSYAFQLKDVRVYTYGSPRVGNQVLYEVSKSMIPVSRRFTHMHDIVPSVPAAWMGYHHVALEIFQRDYIDSNTNSSCRSYHVCDGSGEDPHCHASMCRLGFCTSLSDHTEYLGIAMHANKSAC